MRELKIEIAIIIALIAAALLLFGPPIFQPPASGEHQILIESHFGLERP